MYLIIGLFILQGSAFCQQAEGALNYKMVINYDPKICFTTYDNLHYNLKALVSLSDKLNVTVVSPYYREIENKSVLDYLNSIGDLTSISFDVVLYNNAYAITKVPNGFYVTDNKQKVIAMGNMESGLFDDTFLEKLISTTKVGNY